MSSFMIVAWHSKEFAQDRVAVGSGCATVLNEAFLSNFHCLRVK